MEPPSWREAQGSGARDGPAGRPRQVTPAEPQVADSDAELEEEAGWGCPPSPGPCSSSSGRPSLSPLPPTCPLFVPLL